VIMNDDAMDPLAFAVVPKREERLFKKETRDIELLTKVHSFDALTNKLSVYSESRDIGNIFIGDAQIRGVLQANPDLIRYIHITDQWTLHRL